MNKLLRLNIVDYLFNTISLKFYEKEQELHRKAKQTEKEKIIRSNRIVVKINNDVIYDSKKDKNMSDELYYALLSYGLLETVNSKSKNSNKKNMINYNICSTISTMPNMINS